MLNKKDKDLCEISKDIEILCDNVKWREFNVEHVANNKWRIISNEREKWWDFLKENQNTFQLLIPEFTLEFNDNSFNATYKNVILKPMLIKNVGNEQWNSYAGIALVKNQTRLSTFWSLSILWGSGSILDNGIILNTPTEGNFFTNFDIPNKKIYIRKKDIISES